MTWVRIHDGAPSNPKLLAVGPEAAWLWVAGLAYANSHVTDGFIPPQALPALYVCDQWTRRRLDALAAALVTARLWIPREGGGWLIHGYVEYQREAMRDRVTERRDWEAERKAKQRAAAKIRAGGAVVSDGKTSAPENMSQWDTGGTAVGQPQGTAVGQGPVAPVVVPAPRPVPSRPDPGTEIQKPEIAGVGAAPLQPQQAFAPSRKPRGPKPPATAEMPPADPVARAIYDFLTADPVLRDITARPADLAERMVVPGAYPGVNVLAQVHRAAAHAAGARRPYRDGRAFLLGWLGRADREPPEASPLASGVITFDRYGRSEAPARPHPPLMPAPREPEERRATPAELAAMRAAAGLPPRAPPPLRTGGNHGR